MHLRNDHAFRAVDDEGAVQRHERNVAHIDVLLFDVLNRLCAGFLIDIENNETKGHLQGRRIGHRALLAFLDVVFGFLEMIIDIFQERGLGEIADREDRFEDRLQAHVDAPAFGLLDLQKLVIGGLLDLDQVRHFRYFDHVAEIFAEAFAACE